MLTMKNKKKSEPAKDQHVSTFMVRMPEIYRTQLQKLQEKERRSITAEVIIGVEERLAKFGLWPPEEEGKKK